VSKEGQNLLWDAYRSGNFDRLVDAMVLAVREMEAAQGVAVAR
jgi:hypothetical protein